MLILCKCFCIIYTIFAFYYFLIFIFYLLSSLSQVGRYMYLIKAIFMKIFISCQVKLNKTLYKFLGFKWRWSSTFARPLYPSTWPNNALESHLRLIPRFRTNFVWIQFYLRLTVPYGIPVGVSNAGNSRSAKDKLFHSFNLQEEIQFRKRGKSYFWFNYFILP